MRTGARFACGGGPPGPFLLCQQMREAGWVLPRHPAGPAAPPHPRLDNAPVRGRQAVFRACRSAAEHLTGRGSQSRAGRTRRSAATTEVLAALSEAIP
jgi:hypothetical protein